MAFSSQPQPPPSDGSSHGNRLSRWLSRLLHRTTNNNPSATNPVEVQQQQQQQPVHEHSHSGTISSENNTAITPESLSHRRHRRRSRWRRVFRRPRREKANPGLDLTEVRPHRGFSPPRNRQQPEWMRQSRDDVADRVGKSGESDRRSKEAGGETDVAGGAGKGVSVSGSERNDVVIGESSIRD